MCSGSQAHVLLPIGSKNCQNDDHWIMKNGKIKFTDHGNWLDQIHGSSRFFDPQKLDQKFKMKFVIL